MLYALDRPTLSARHAAPQQPDRRSDGIRNACGRCRSCRASPRAGQGRRRIDVSKVRVGIIGVGNCASSLVQGVSFYRDAAADEFIPGLMHAQLGPYHVGDVEFSAAIDIDRDKVGKGLVRSDGRPHPTTRRSSRMSATWACP